MVADTNEQAKAYAAALVEELRGAELRVAIHDADENANPNDRQALLDRVKDVKAELSRVTEKAKPPAKRAERRPRAKKESR